MLVVYTVYLYLYNNNHHHMIIIINHFVVWFLVVFVSVCVCCDMWVMRDEAGGEARFIIITYSYIILGKFIIYIYLV